MPGNILLLRGRVVCDGTKSFAAATVYVRLEDVSRLDAPSTVIVEQVLDNVSYRAGSQVVLEFALYGQVPDKEASYIVRVHIDTDGDGRISRGDYLSMEGFPVLTYGYPHEVTVRVQEVT